MMELEPHGPDTWVGVGPQYPWGGLYGGQIVAQGLGAAAKSIDEAFIVHSLHAYFIRRGDASAPVRYEVDRIRDGRSFATRRVVARQSAGAILNLSASFWKPDGDAHVQDLTAPDVPRPEELKVGGWSTAFERRSIRYRERTRRQAWLKVKQPLPDDPVLHACALAFESDDLPTEAVVARHPDHIADPTVSVWNASLDHAIWFHAPVKADDHLLHDFTCPALRGSRGLSVGHIFDAKGTLIATVNQEVLVRHRRT